MSKFKIKNIIFDLCACLFTLRNRSIWYFKQLYYRWIYYTQCKKIYEFQLPYPFAKTIFASRVIVHHVRMGKKCIIREEFLFQMNNNNAHQIKKHIKYCVFCLITALKTMFHAHTIIMGVFFNNVLFKK